jgi:hypothetical protein
MEWPSMAELKLRADQQRFFLAILQGKSQEDAYRAAKFPRGDEISDKVARRGAGGYMKSDVGVTALEFARKAASDGVMQTIEDIVAKLEKIYQVAFQCDPPQLSAGVAAQMGIAKLLGLYVDQKQVNIVHHKPSLLPTKHLELSEEEWKRQFVEGPR